MGIAPGQSAPSGQYIYPYTASGSQGVAHTQTDWTTATLTSVMKTPVVASYSNAQDNLNSQVIMPIATNAAGIESHSTSLNNHENRITVLENHDQIAQYGSNATWTKPSPPPTFSWVHHRLVAIGGAGGVAKPGTGSNSTAIGGGQGGYNDVTLLDAAVPSTMAIVVGSGGRGPITKQADDSFVRTDSSSLGSAWRTDSGSSSARIWAHAVEAIPMAQNTAANGNWHTYNNSYLADNVIVTAQLHAPSASSATDNITAIYLAAPATYSGSTKLVGFGVTTGSGCAIWTQVNSPSSPYRPTGLQTGQAAVVTSTTNVPNTAQISLSRVGNVFTAYVNGVSILSWTDSSNTVPTGATNRHFCNGFAGTNTTINSTSSVGGGGPGGTTTHTATPTPASNGTGNVSTITAYGGNGYDATQVPPLSAGVGGSGYLSNGGTAGTTSIGGNGQGVPAGQIGPGGGGGGAGNASSQIGCTGGDGGYPGGGGGAGSNANGFLGDGGFGAAGEAWVISSIT